MHGTSNNFDDSAAAGGGGGVAGQHPFALSARFQRMLMREDRTLVQRVKLALMLRGDLRGQRRWCAS